MDSRLAVGEILFAGDFTPKVYLTTNYQGYDYFAYQISDTQVVFKSLNPTNFPPTQFVLFEDGNNVRILSETPLLRYLNPSGSLSTTPTSYSLNSELGLPPGKVYAGVYYVFQNSAWRPPVSNRSTSSAPFGGESSGTTLVNGLKVMFIMTQVIDSLNGTFDVPYVINNNVCIQISNIAGRTASWMEGQNNGCDDLNTCIFTNKLLCESKRVPEYCNIGETCGSCIGTCLQGEVCVYDFAQTQQPFYSCNPLQPNPIPINPPPPIDPPPPGEEPPISPPTTVIPDDPPEESFWEKYKIQILVILGIIILIAIIGIIMYAVRSHKKVSVTS